MWLTSPHGTTWYENVSIAATTTATHRPNPTSGGFSQPGHLAVVANAFTFACRDVPLLRKLMFQHNPDEVQLNGLVFSTITQLLHVLDGIAVYSQRHAPIPQYDNKPVYFDKYDFATSTEFAVLGVLQRKTKELRYGNIDFFTLANDLKHRFPWVGSHSISDTRGIGDIFRADSGILADVIEPLIGSIREAISMLNYKLPATDMLILSFAM